MLFQLIKSLQAKMARYVKNLRGHGPFPLAPRLRLCVTATFSWNFLSSSRILAASKQLHFATVENSVRCVTKKWFSIKEQIFSREDKLYRKLVTNFSINRMYGNFFRYFPQNSRKLKFALNVMFENIQFFLKRTRSIGQSKTVGYVFLAVLS